MRSSAPIIIRRTSHISAFMFDHLHWLPLIARIQLKVLTLIYRSHIGQAPTYLRDLVHRLSSAISLRPLRSLDRHDLFVSRARTSMAQTRHTSLCNHWPIALEPTPFFYSIHFMLLRMSSAIMVEKSTTVS